MGPLIGDLQAALRHLSRRMEIHQGEAQQSGSLVAQGMAEAYREACETIQAVIAKYTPGRQLTPGGQGL